MMPRLLDPDRLRRARTLRGLTQRELADAADLSENTIVFYETGKVDPTPASLIKVAAALELDVLDLAPMPPLPGLSDVRHRRGLSATAMGELLGVSHTTVTRVEQGDPAYGDIADWADAYQLTVEEWTEAHGRGPWAIVNRRRT